MMSKHDGSEGYTEGYADGYRKAQTNDRGNLAAVLRNLIETGEPPLDINVAREIFAAVHGSTESKREFGSDPRIDNIIDGLFE